MDFKELLDRYLKGQSSQEEDALLERFFEQSGEQDKQAHLSEQDKTRMFKAFRESPRFSVKKRISIWWQAAAVLLLLLGCWKWVQVSYSDKMIAYKEINSPKGALLKVKLPDSSMVILNANSTLRYAADFTTRRDLQLTGEALFDVSKDKEHPFIIHTASGIQTTVLGTSFTIRSYDNLPETKIMVITGRVQVQHADTVLRILGSNEQLIYNRLNDDSHRDVLADAGKQAGWTRGEWEYENMPLQKLQALLFNYYNIHLITKRDRFSG